MVSDSHNLLSNNSSQTGEFTVGFWVTYSHILSPKYLFSVEETQKICASMAKSLISQMQIPPSCYGVAALAARPLLYAFDYPVGTNKLSLSFLLQGVQNRRWYELNVLDGVREEIKVPY